MYSAVWEHIFYFGCSVWKHIVCMITFLLGCVHTYTQWGKLVLIAQGVITNYHCAYTGHTKHILPQCHFVPKLYASHISAQYILLGSASLR